MTSKAIRVPKNGGREVLEYLDVEDRPPGPGEVVVRNRAIGVNFIDVYHRTGLYPMPLPTGLGIEGAGVVESVGAGVVYVKPGDRVAYCTAPLGAYAERHVIPAEKLIKLPDGVSDEAAAAGLLKGVTVYMLLKQVHAVRAGETIVQHAAAGGVGLILSQWAKTIGARTIGVVSSKEKADLARAHGCDEVILTSENIPECVRALTNGAGVPVVYDSVGKDTFFASLDCLAPRGLMVSFGNASGPAPAFELQELAKRGSLFITRPSALHYLAKPDDLRAAAADLFALIESGAVKIAIGARFKLADAAKAHEALESRKTTGSTILLP
jgi:NADPH:quinone reductase